jgi:hypothetical protein
MSHQSAAEAMESFLTVYYLSVASVFVFLASVLLSTLSVRTAEDGPSLPHGRSVNRLQYLGLFILISVMTGVFVFLFEKAAATATPSAAGGMPILFYAGWIAIGAFNSVALAGLALWRLRDVDPAVTKTPVIKVGVFALLSWCLTIQGPGGPAFGIGSLAAPGIIDAALGGFFIVLLFKRGAPRVAAE